MKKLVQKIKDNREEILSGAVFVTLVSACVALAYYGEKYEMEAQEKRNNYIRQQNKLGRTVYTLADGSLIGVPND